jgi:hypothetical protein
MTQDKFVGELAKDDWDNHRLLLWLALEETKIGEVIEMGCGDGSTRQLHEYCEDRKRLLYSFDTELDWINRFANCKSERHRFYHIENNWQIAQKICPMPSVILIDHAPGERRWVDIKNYSDKIEGIMVVHDSQPPPTAADYVYEKIWHLFKYRVNLEVDKHESGDNRTWASAVSNHYDVTKWAGKETGRPDYRIR